jgi:PIN domain nuclease of toxin-antitoxin system
MKLLIDTHTFLWAIGQSAKLSQTCRDLLTDGNNEVLLSAASLWEIAIKLSLGKLTLGGSFETFIPLQLALNRIEILEATLQHYAVVATLPQHHRDPFDRLIIAQAQAESLPVVSIDDKFDPYGVKRLW